MKRHTKTTCVVALIATLGSFGSGCAFVGEPLKGDPDAGRSLADEREATSPGELERPDEEQNWSRLTKEGREHLLVGRYSMAEESLLEALRISKSFRPRDVRRRVSFGNLELLARRYLAAGYEASARRVLGIIAAETQGQSEFDYPRLSDLLLKLGQLEADSGNVERAAVADQRALDLRTEKSGPDSPTLIEVLQRLSSLEIQRDQPDRAVAHAQRALELADTHIGENSREAIAALLQAATAHQVAGDFSASEEQFRRALDTQREIEASTLTEATALNGLAILYLRMGRLEEALGQVDHALSILELLKRQGVDRAMILDTKAQILAAQGQSESAQRLFDEIMLHVDSARPADRRTLYESYLSFLMDQKRTAEAQRIREQIDGLGGDPAQKEVKEEASFNGAPGDAAPMADVAAPEPSASWDH